MFGSYQHSDLRVELSATAEQISAGIIQPANLKQWLWPQQLNFTDMSNELVVGQIFESRLGIVDTVHQVETISPEGVRFLLSGSIDGFHEWQWGDGWVQSRLEGVSLLPLNLGQTLSLLRLKQYLQSEVR